MFVSGLFFVFLGITVSLYFCVRITWRAGVLLLASWLFCGFLDWRALAVLVLISVSAYFSGLHLEPSEQKAGRRKALLAVMCGLYVLLLCGYKYIPYGLGRLGLTESVPESVLVHLVMPIGLSFYLFQAIGYLVDIYKGKSRAERSFVSLSLYFAFFPKLVSGPIEREGDFLPQLKELETVRFLDRGRLSLAATYLLWGYFMKMVVADRLALTVAKLFEAPGQYDSLWLLLGMLFYTMQIYCDFAGYSCIAIGCGAIFGIRLTNNFAMPYCAKSITEFWRRWHISLSSWLRDYVYIPLGGNRKGRFRKCLNTMAVFLICGMWHGAGLNFVAWGLLHGVYSVADTLFGRKKSTGQEEKKVASAARHVLTFLAVSFAWIFFRASGLKSALVYVWEMLTSGMARGSFAEGMSLLELGEVELGVIVIGILVVWIADIICSRKKEQLPELVQHKQNAVRYLVFYLLLLVIFVFGMYGPGYQAEDFIYMQF